MKVLAINHEGDPLFVRDERGRDFEVEVHVTTDTWSGARFFHSHSGTIANPSSVAVPPTRVLMAHSLPTAEERDEHRRRARGVALLGGDVEDPVSARRRRADTRNWVRSVQRPAQDVLIKTESLVTKMRSIVLSATAQDRVAGPSSETQEKRAEALRRLQDPPTLTPHDVMLFIDGLRSRDIL